MSHYLDIHWIKACITMAHILSFYGISLRRQTNDYRLTGCCPIHNGDNPNAFHVDLKRNLFNCFTRCGGGSIFDFVMKMEHLDFYGAAMKIWNSFGITFKQRSGSPGIPEYPGRKQCQYRPSSPIPRLTLQPEHPYLRKRNISPSLARKFQMGFCAWGIMKNRIAIPIIEPLGHTVAYCGRAVQENQKPKYLFPKNFHKSNHLFNIQSIKPGEQQQVFIVEGFFDCINIVRAGLRAIALMGTTISGQQLLILKRTRRSYILMLDGDDAGKKATPQIALKLKQYRIPFRIVYLVGVKEPEQLDEDYLKIVVAK